MTYTQSVLMPGERVLYSGRVSWLAMWRFLIPAGLGLFWLVAAVGVGDAGQVLAAVLVMAASVGAAYARSRFSELTVTTQRVIAKTGVLGRETVELELARLEGVQLRQTVGGRVLGYGTLIFSGAGVPQAAITRIRSPLEFRQAVLAAKSRQSRPAAR